jgi:hypothetical protein
LTRFNKTLKPNPINSFCERLMTRIEQFFEDNSLSPMPDNELMLLFSDVDAFMTSQQIATYVEHCKRFDTRPVHVTEEDQSEKVVYWYCLRDDLRALPTFFLAGKKVGLTEDQCNILAVNLLDAYKYDSRHGDCTVTLADDILSHLIENGQAFDLPLFQAFLLIAREDGEITRALRIVKLCMNAGLSLEQSTDIVKRIYEAPGIVGYALRDFYDEIDALRANDLEPSLLYESLKTMIELDITPSWFTEFLEIATARSPLSQTEILKHFLDVAVTPRPPKTDEDVLSAIFKSLITEGNDTRKPVTDYFPKISGDKLILGRLPYRMSKSLEDGLSDLKTVMEEAYTQGAWVFDPESETWYSMGGRNRSSLNGVRHEFQAYDISSLSKTPILVKTNPKRCEIMIAPNRRELEFPQLEARLTAFLTAMPSGADLGMISALRKKAAKQVPITGLIVSSQGVTHFSVPDETAAVDEIAPKLRFLKGQVITELDHLAVIKEFGTNGKSPEFVRFMKGKLISLLPPGFVITAHTFKGYIDYLHRQSITTVSA